MIDKGSAKDAGYHVGDRIGVSAQGPIRRYTISGIARFGNVDSLGGATIGVFDVPTAQALLHKAGQFDVIFLARPPGGLAAQLVQRVRPLLPPSAQVRSGDQQASTDTKDTKDATKIIQYVLLGFAGIALLVGSFVIFNTLSITVAQRIREFATLRTLGASRRQVMRSVLLEGFAIGLLASVAGLFLGLALAKGLNAVFDALGLSLPHTGTVFKSRTVYVSIIVGTVVTVVSTLGPALRATHVPPVAAVREGATLPPSGVGRRSTVISSLTLAAGAALLILGVFGSGATGGRLLFMGLGVLLLMIGVGLVAKRLVRPLAAVVGAPARRFGGEPGQLASGNSTRNPARTASTAAALMIGLTLVTLVATLAAGLRNSDKKALERQVNADYVMTSKNGFDTFSAAAGTAAARAPGVTAVASVRDDRAKVFGKSLDVFGVDPAAARLVRLNWTQGSPSTLATLGSNGAVLDHDYAKKHHVGVGGAFEVTTPAGRQVTFVVRGIQKPTSVDKLDPIFTKVHRVARGLRRGVPAAQEHPHLPLGRGRLEPPADRGAEVRAVLLPRRPGGDQGGVGAHPLERHQQAAEPALRPARPLGGGEHLRDGEHADPVGLRAHPGAGHAQGHRDDAPAGAPHGAGRERDHGADRRGPWAAPRRAARRGLHAGALGLGSGLLGAAPVAGGLRPGGGGAGRARVPAAGPPGGAAQRARGAPVRVAGSTARPRPGCPPGRARAGARRSGRCSAPRP